MPSGTGAASKLPAVESARITKRMRMEESNLHDDCAGEKSRVVPGSVDGSMMLRCRGCTRWLGRLSAVAAGGFSFLQGFS